MVKWLVVTALVFGATVRAAAPSSPKGEAPAESGNATSPIGSPAFTLTQTQAVRVAKLDYVGPYWSMGPVVGRVHEAMTFRGERGPIVIRYLNDPFTTPPQQLRSEIGYIAHGGVEPMEPFTVTDWPPEFVAQMTVSEPNRYNARHLRRLRAWAIDQGLAPTGPVVELLHFPSDGAVGPSPRLEIRMPVCQPDPESPATMADDPVEPDPRETAGRATALPLVHADSPNVVPMDDFVKPSAEIMIPITIADLIDAGRFDDLAIQLLPDGLRTADPTRLWLQQIVLRVSAVARGVQKQYPGQEGWLVGVTRAFVQRVETLTSVGYADVQTQRRVPLSPPARDVHSEQRKKITRRLELLMGRVAVKSIGAEEVRNELAAVLQEAQDLLATERK